MKQALAAFLIILIFIVIFRVLEIRKERLESEIYLHNLLVQKEEFKIENQKLEKSIGYFSFLENLEKEVKAQFNFRQIGEKLIIIVPPKTD